MELSQKKVVVLGGGTGTYQILSGLKKYPIKLSAVISMCDSGGSTGKLRKELGILPPGDVRRAILALSDLPFAQKTLEELFDFRFDNGKSFRGHSVGNILLAALTQLTGSMDKAIEEAARILHTSGNVYPVTLDKTNLVAILEDGTRIHGETNIDMRDVKPKIPIKKVFLKPKAKIYTKASSAIQEADLVVIAPGDLYTSIIATLLVDGAKESIGASDAEVVVIINLLTKRGETTDFTATNHIREIEKYLGDAQFKIKHVFVNKQTKIGKKKIENWYKHYGSKPVQNDLKENPRYKIIEKDFLSSTTLLRHDPDKIARAIISIFD